MAIQSTPFYNPPHNHTTTLVSPSLDGGAGAVCLSPLASLFKLILPLSLSVAAGEEGDGGSTLPCTCVRVCVCARAWSMCEDERRIGCCSVRRGYNAGEGVESPRRGALVHTLTPVSSASAKCCFTLVSSFAVSAPSGSFGKRLHWGAKLSLTFLRIAPLRRIWVCQKR